MNTKIGKRGERKPKETVQGGRVDPLQPYTQLSLGDGYYCVLSPSPYSPEDIEALKAEIENMSKPKRTTKKDKESDEQQSNAPVDETE